jgi:hypothetical protein
MAIDLSGLIKAGLSGATGYFAGEQAKRQADEKRAIAEQERMRQAQEDALRDALLRAQTDANNALAQQRRTPDAPTVRNIDPLSPEGIDASTKRAEAIAKARARYATTQPKAPSATDANDEAQGRAIMQQMGASGNAPIENKQAFWQAYLYATKENPSLPKGRAAKQVMDALKQSRPDLFRQAGGYSAFGGSPSPAPASTPAPGYTPDAQARFNGGQANAGQTGPASIDPAVLTEARTLIQGSADPQGDLRSSGFTDDEIKAILGAQ